MAEERSQPSPPSTFVTTHWSVVLQAGIGEEEQARKAIELLCETYRPPVHAFVQRWTRSASDADDLTQEFFVRFLAKQHFKSADPERGRFRHFLLTSVRNFLINAGERARSLKRGGGATILSLNEQVPEGSPRIELADGRTAESDFEASWAMALLRRTRERIAEEYSRAGKGPLFQVLEQFLPGEETQLTYADAARQLGVAEGTIKSDMHRLRRRYAAALRDEVANTVWNLAEVEDELRHLRRVLGARTIREVQ